MVAAGEATVEQVDRSIVEVRSSVIGASRTVLWIWHDTVADGTVRATEEILGARRRRCRQGGAAAGGVRDNMKAMQQVSPTGARRRIHVGL
jgi:hypothetical protein